MNELLNIILRAIFTENLALAYLLGMCTFLAVSQRVQTAIGLGIAVIFVQTITVPLNQLVFNFLLAPGALSWAGLGHLDLGYMRFIVFIGIIAAFIQVLEQVLDRYFPDLHHALGIYLPLLTVNCAILGASLFMVHRDFGFAQSLAFGFGSGAGWALAIIMFAAIRERLRCCDVPRGLEGHGVAFVVMGILAIGFLGLRGVAF